MYSTILTRILSHTYIVCCYTLIAMHINIFLLRRNMKHKRGSIYFDGN